MTAETPFDAEPRMFEADMTLPDGQRVHLVGASKEVVVDHAATLDAALQRTAEQAVATTSNDRPTPPDVTRVCRATSRDLLDALGPLDPLDVLTMLLWSLAPDLSNPHESTNTIWDALALTEPVALAALAKDSPTGDPTSPVEPYLTDTHAAAAGILDLAVQEGLWQISRTTTDLHDPSTRLASRLAGHERVVRGRQYETVALRINEAVLGSPRATAALTHALGFSYDDISKVRAALHDAIDDLNHWLLDSMEQRVAELRNPPAENASAPAPGHGPQQAKQLRTVDVDTVARLAGLDEHTTQSVLQFFSVAASDQPLAALIESYVCGNNPLRQRQLLQTADTQFFVMADGILPDEIRRTCEAGLKLVPKAWNKYEPARSTALEALARDVFGQLLPGAELHSSIKYRYPQHGEDLSQGSTTAGAADLAEADLLVLVDGVVLCVEAKAGDFTERGRQGDATRLQRDLKKTVTEASAQAQRLERLISDNHGLWLADGSWMPIPRAHEFHHVIVCLDDMGPLVLNAQELVDAHALSGARVPWIISIHDLLVIQDILRRPYNFLTYLRRRTTPEASRLIVASDEMDLLMWFVNGGLYFEPDPRRTRSTQQPDREPTAAEIRAYEDQGTTFVLTLTDPLDAYMYSLQTGDPQRAARPERAALQPPLDALARLLRGRDSGEGLRACSDLDELSRPSQVQLVKNIGHMTQLHRRDRELHSITQVTSDDRGRFLVIFAIAPDPGDAVAGLMSYAQTRKHASDADRALVVLLNTAQQPHLVAWLEGEEQEDVELDARARAMRLVPNDRAARVVPPRVRLAAKHAHKAKPKKRKRRR